MTAENNANEPDSLRENSKEWAPSFTVDGVTYAASIFWESLQNVDAPFLDAKRLLKMFWWVRICFALTMVNLHSLVWLFPHRDLKKG